MATVEDTIVKEVMKKAVKGIDLNALAVKLQPKIEQEIIAAVLMVLKDEQPFYDAVNNFLESKVFTAVVETKLKQAFGVTQS